MTSPFRLEQAMSALLAARARMLADDPSIADDDQMLADMLEGDISTGDAMDVIDAVIRQSVEQGVFAEAAYEYANKIRRRALAFERRQDALRAMAFAALDALGLKQHKRPDFTASLRQGKQSTFVTDESLLPNRFWKTSRSLQMRELSAALGSGEEVPGAELRNGSPSLSIRTQ